MTKHETFIDTTEQRASIDTTDSTDLHRHDRTRNHQHTMKERASIDITKHGTSLNTMDHETSTDTIKHGIFTAVAKHGTSMDMAKHRIFHGHDETQNLPWI